MTRFIGRPDSVFGGNPGFLQDGILNAFITGNVNAGEVCTIFESGCIRRTDPTLPWSAINCDGGVSTTKVPVIPPPPCTTSVALATVQVQQTIQSTDVVQTGLPPGFVVNNSLPAGSDLITFSPVTCLTPPALVTNVSCSGQTVGNCCGVPARLIDGTYCVPLQTSTGIGFSIQSSSGNQITNFIAINADVSVTAPHCVALPNGNFSVIWVTSSTLKHCVVSVVNGVYTPGTIRTITTICSTANLVPWFGHCALGNGNFVVTYTTTGGVLEGVFYTGLGVIVGSPFTIDGTCTLTHHACYPCANGDFVHYGFDTAHNLFKIYRITNGGIVTWGPITPAGCGTAVFDDPLPAQIHPQFNRILELPFGVVSLPNICVSFPNSSQYCNQFILRGDTGALINTCDIGTQFHDQFYHNPVCLTPNGFCVTHTLSAQTTTYCSFFDYNGRPQNQNILCDSGAHSFPAVNTPSVITYCGFANQSICINRYALDSLGNVEVRCIHTDVAGNVLGTPFAILPFGPSNCNSPCPICDTDGSCFVFTFTSGPSQCQVTCLKVGRSSVIGVAQASATNGEPVTIVSEGYFNLPSTQIFGPGVAFDRRESLPNGARGVVGGQVAILFGWV